MRTLVVSDLHLGARSGRDRLRDPDVRGRLLAALAGVDRLVLLGDVVEFRQGPQAQALDLAEPVLHELAGALSAGAEVVLVPGNHDHHLLSRWRERRGAPPHALSEAVDPEPADPLGRLAGSLAPAAVRVAYPGIWLRDDVYATHGHYLDRHTTVPSFERLGIGAMARVIGEPESGPSTVADYEAVLAPLYAWIHAVAQQDRGPAHGASARAWRALAAEGPAGRLRRLGVKAGFATAIAAVNRARIGPVSRDLSGSELRRAALRAMGEVVRRLDIAAPYVIFGHTHRAGPLPRDDRAAWLAPGGTQLVNTGSWVFEPAFLGRDPAVSPYRAGFAVRLGDEGAPELVNLLD